MNDNEWTTPEGHDDRAERLLAAIPFENAFGDTEGATARLVSVLNLRKHNFEDKLRTFRYLLDQDERDSVWTDKLTNVAAALCEQASVVRDIYHVGAGIGVARVRQERRVSANEWREEALGWARLADRAAAVARERRNDERLF